MCFGHAILFKNNKKGGDIMTKQEEIYLRKEDIELLRKQFYCEKCKSSNVSVHYMPKFVIQNTLNGFFVGLSTDSYADCYCNVCDHEFKACTSQNFRLLSTLELIFIRRD
jgi:hypothetical protein